MRASHLFGDTLRDVPADAEIASHQLLLRAGYVRQLAAGIFSYLPPGLRALRRLEAIVREEIEAIGGQELTMPVVHPAEIWQRSGRWQTIDESLVRFRDRRGRDLALAMTHEEAVATLASTEIRSYRQLPQLVYQIQTKFRDEPRSRGGLIRTREFTMKDSYSLDRDQAGLERQYAAHHAAYLRIFARAGLPVIAVGSDVGVMGGSAAHEFMYLTPIGEDTLVLCPSCGYAANQEIARFRKQPFDGGPALPLETVATPGTETIADLAAFLEIDPRATAKAVFFMGDYGDNPPRLIIAIVRGDMEANPTPILQLSGARSMRSAQIEEITAVGAVPGYGSPIGVDRTRTVVIIDDLVAESTNLVAGANRPGYHLRNTNVGRDYTPDAIGNIVQTTADAPCSVCGSALELARGVEVGNIFQLSTRYGEALGATFVDEDGVERPIVMGSYGIGIGRLLACVAEQHHDDRGLTLPIAVAPFEVALVAIARRDETRAAADRLYTDLQRAGIDVLYDDREVSAGVKFADADLRGLPLRITVSDRSLQNHGVELKLRAEKEFRVIAIDQALAEIQASITALRTMNDPAT